MPAPQDPRHILIVEDDSADVFLISEAINAANPNVELEVVNDGDKAIRFFEKIDRDDSLACPALVILDINLPKRHGGQVLQHMRKTRRCASALVLIVTSSDSARDRETMARLGANGYFRSPPTGGTLHEAGRPRKGITGPQIGQRSPTAACSRQNPPPKIQPARYSRRSPSGVM